MYYFGVRQDMRQKSQIRQENEERILAAAEDVFSELGYRGASVGMIAERADVPKPNVYYYFGSKDDLYRRVMEDVCRDWMQLVDNFNPSLDPATAISDYVRSKMRLARDRPKGSRIWAMEMVRGASFLQDYFRDIMAPWLAEREAVLKAWIEAGKMAPVDARQFFYLIWATTQHYADFSAQIVALDGPEFFKEDAFERATDEVVRLILRAAGLAD